MIEPYESWLRRKLELPPIELLRAWTMTKKWERVTGGRILFAELTLTAEPSNNFSYDEKAIWPTADNKRFTDAVLDGILDAALIDLGHTPVQVAFTLEAVVWQEEHSVSYAYSQAAHEAVIEIFAANENERLKTL